MRELADIQPNRQFWNVVKGLGILLVIIGHSCAWSVEYVYIFHLQLFFFVSGYLYNERKYGDKPFVPIKKRFFSLWVVYIVVSLFLVLLHNPLYDIGMQRLDCIRYTPKELLLNILYCFIGNSKELLGGTVWFLPVLFLVMVILILLIYVTRLIEKATGQTWLKLTIQGIVIVCLTYIGYRLIAGGKDWIADFQVVCAVMLYTWVGYLIRNYYNGVSKIMDKMPVRIIIIILAAIGLVYVYWYSTRHWVDLIFGSVQLQMYIPGLVGIFSSLVVAWLINKVPVVNKAFNFMGDNSLVIMIVHYPVIKIVDKIVCLNIGDPDKTLYDKIPMSFPEIWPVYLVACIVVSVICVFIVKGVKKLLKRNKK
ncbi:MAG: acyltransferase [Lachnospiraceae bacterium]|nr:acyltransferase [Lachnospiraceae bacterium]